MNKLKREEENNINRQDIIAIDQKRGALSTTADDTDDDDDDDDDYKPPQDEIDNYLEDNQLFNKNKRRKLKNDLNSWENDSIKNEDIEAKKPQAVTFDQKRTDELWASFLNDTKSTKKVEISKLPDDKIKLEERLFSQVTKPDNKVSFIKSNIVLNDCFESGVYSKNISLETNPNNIKKKTTEVTGNLKLSGMSSLLKKFKNEPKMSTLEKSKLDWEEFKKAEKIEEDLATDCKGKQSYLERKAFLERSDIRQFELEKEFRDKERKLREKK